MQRLLIQTALINLARASSFYQVKYDQDTGLPIQYDPTTVPTIPPSSVQCNEVSSKWVEDKQYGQGRVLVKVGWGFELYLEWDLEVDLDVFEEALMKALPFLPAANGMPSVTLMLLQKGVSHPVTQGSGTGTKAKYLVQAELGRA